VIRQFQPVGFVPGKVVAELVDITMAVLLVQALQRVLLAVGPQSRFVTFRSLHEAFRFIGHTGWTGGGIWMQDELLTDGTDLLYVIESAWIGDGDVSFAMRVLSCPRAMYSM
jgi:hypothetical protein